MKRILITLSLLALTALLAGGCDFLRSLAGRPTSAQIEAKRAMIEAERLSRRERLDSLKVVEKELADSLELLDRIREEHGMVLGSGSLNGLEASMLSERYYVVIGTFANADNARRLSAKAAEAGYEVTVIPYSNGFTAVGVGATRNLSDAYRTLTAVKREAFCPPDVWVLVNE